MIRSKYMTIPNVLTMVRLLLLWPVLVCLKNGNGYIAIVFIALAAATDTADGYIARRFNQISDIGKAFDPVVDKVFTITIVSYLVLSPDYMMPFGFLLFIAARELLLVAGGLYIIKKHKIVLMAEKPGKYSAFFNGIVIVMYILKYNYSLNFLLVAVGFTLYSTYVYITKFIKELKG